MVAKLKNKSIKNNIGVIITLYIVLNISASILTLNYILSVTPQGATSFIKLTAYLSVFMNSGITLLTFLALLFILFAILKYIEVEIQLNSYYSASIWFLSGYCFYELLRLFNSAIFLKSMLINIQLNSMDEFIVFMDNDLTDSKWMKNQTILSNIFLFISSALFGLNLKIKGKLNWLDCSISSWVLFMGLYIFKLIMTPIKSF